MRKIRILSAIVVAGMLVVGCGGGNDEATDAPSPLDEDAAITGMFGAKGVAEDVAADAAEQAEDTNEAAAEAME